MGNNSADPQRSNNRGNASERLQDLKLHLRIAEETGDKSKQNSLFCQLGNAYHSLGDFKQAIHYHDLHLKIAKEVGDRTGEGGAYCNLGIDYAKLGDFKQAIDYHELHLKFIKEVGITCGKEVGYCNLGNDYAKLGDFKKAIHYHDLDLENAKRMGDKSGEGSAYGNLGNIYHMLGDLEKAIHYHELHLHVAKDRGDKGGEGAGYCNLGSNYGKLGDFKKAIHYHELFLKFTKEVGDRAGEGVAYGCLGVDYTSLGDFKKAINYHELDLQIEKEVGDNAGEGNAYFNLGCALESQGSLLNAVTCYRASIRALSDVRARLRFKDEWKISLCHQYQTVYTSLWCALLKQFKVEEALVAADQGRAQALKDLLECQFKVETSQHSSRILQETNNDNLIGVPSNTVFVAVRDQHVYLWVIHRGKGVDLRSTGISESKSVDLSDFFHSLMKNAFKTIGVIACVNCEDRSLDSLRDEEWADGRSDETQSHPLHLHSNAFRQLYDIIIDPIADLIQGDELIIVPEGPLCLAPYAAFMDPDSKYLSETFRIRVIPSLTSLKLIGDCPPDYHHKNGALLVGDPWVQEIVISKKRKLQQLPCAKEEVEIIGRILNTAPLTGTEATKDEVLKRLSSVALVHIAAHGRMETGEIALSPNPSRAAQIPRKADYLLTMTDVLRVKLRARLVVLSSCHSGRGEIKAEGVVGIARAFLGAGARSVLVSLWAIDDEATLEFMKGFYRHLKEGRSASEALNRAMKCMRESDKFSEVKYWAPFVLIGDDVTLEFGGDG